MATRHPILPADPRYYSLSVVRSVQVSPSYQRVTTTGPELASLDYLGADHWFRLFLPAAGADRQGSLRLPSSPGRGWYPQFLAIPQESRPHLANYTIRDFRADDLELDIDFVLHSDADGAPAGRAAIWAADCEPGDRLAILDQGLLFNPPRNTSEWWLVADETGLPAAESILRTLDPDASGCAVLEVPTDGDVRELVKPAKVEVHWVSRADRADDRVHAGALSRLSTVTEQRAPDAGAYAFAVGEAGLATGARRHLADRGLSKSRITFCGFWKH